MTAFLINLVPDTDQEVLMLAKQLLMLVLPKSQDGKSKIIEAV